MCGQREAGIVWAMKTDIMSAKQKALALNFDEKIYGTFAEIGAGQETVRHFFTAGGASRTVAKTMSAYDTVFSDSIYGKERSGRYVCESRLKKMLNHEYALLIERLQKIKPQQTLFFTFANTVTTINFQGDNEAHGWLGLRFQDSVKREVNSIHLHVRMHEIKAVDQQKSLGVLGVNLIYACFYHLKKPERFLASLMDNLSRRQVEIDLIRTEGQAFDGDQRLWGLKLVREGMTDAVMFDNSGEICLAQNQFYKNNVLVHRGSFRPPTNATLAMFKTGLKSFKAQLKNQQDVVQVAEISINKSIVTKEKKVFPEEDFLARIDMLAALKKKVLITRFSHYVHLSSYLNRFRVEEIGMVLGAYHFAQLFTGQRQKLSFFESLGTLFSKNMRLFIYPFQEEDKTLTTSHNLKIAKKYLPFVQFLRDNHYIEDLLVKDATHLTVYSRKVVELFQNKDSGWQKYIPPEILKPVRKLLKES